ncbi:hypothetical protein CGG80_23250 [Vibrio parahaemolyticus]|uniref:hypothetical protein n=1 Tax=Vibrio parahaemolyticus TaxID=670 RepID=UPI00111F6C1B|nr:hypothetical protein [Vibrio parahaemolyticus]EGQ7859371.1 hypothetical protein [Vibrio parahaemolyticus]TOQ03292.1 hypothetical protein CGH03_22055 [Vibrio parahaemolyticus]TOR12067.1 hypothetical protein CGG80_23250 [Vibrio parahaemolyticus]
MALLAEELVEEWLNRQGYFTIRGIKIGVDEIDLLAIRFTENGQPECRHIEVQASMRPISYISRIPKNLLKPGQTVTSAAERPESILRAGVQEWVDKKFRKPKKTAVLTKLFPDKWSSELVHNIVKSDDELRLIAKEGIKLISLSIIIKQLNSEQFPVKSASGADFADLIYLVAQNV